MTAPAKPTIDEQIAKQRSRSRQVNDIEDCILSTLRAHKAIMEAKRPEPVAHMWQHGETGATGFLSHAPDEELRKWERMNKPRTIVKICYGPDLLAYADRVAAEYRKSGGTNKYEGHTLHEWWERAINAERQLAELQRKRDGLVARLREPSEEMQKVSAMRHKCECGRAVTQWASNKLPAMSAVALREGEE